jgi:hypothetical protein
MAYNNTDAIMEYQASRNMPQRVPLLVNIKRKHPQCDDAQILQAKDYFHKSVGNFNY